MQFSILIPHYRTPKMTAYTISQLLKYKGNHDIEIIIIDNYARVGDESYKYFEPFIYDIIYIPYPIDRLQSHGISMNYLLEKRLVKNKWFLTLESDAFPIKENFLDYYENIINSGYDSASSYMQLSGGCYGHPCGGLFNQATWEEADNYAKQSDYVYIPNISIKYDFDSHLMVHKSIINDFLQAPNDYVEVSKSYENKTTGDILLSATKYLPTVCAFHNGMGTLNESVHTYGQRCKETEVPTVILDNKRKLINRVGEEPGQWLYYWLLANNKKVFDIPIEIKWMPNREGQQQEYTINEAGIKHIWAVSSYVERGSKDVEDIYEAKRRIPDELYETLPEHQKIKQ